MKILLRTLIIASLLFETLLLPCSTAYSAEDWKGTPDESSFSFGGLAGLGIIDTSAGFALLGTASQKIVRHGFIPDIANSVSVEVAAGPVFMSGSTPFNFS